MPPIIGILAAPLLGGLITVGQAVLVGASIAVQLAQRAAAKKRAAALERSIRQSFVSARPDFNEVGLSVQQSRDLTLMVKEAIASRRVVYGRARVGGIWFFMEVSNDNNRFLHLVLGLSDGPIEEVEGVYFGDDLLEFDEEGDITGKYNQWARVEWRLGDEDEEEDDPVEFTVDAGNDRILSTAHGLEENDVVSFSSDDTLPGNINAGQSYFVAGVLTDSFKIRATVAGSSINISGTGTGTHSYIHYPGAYWRAITLTENWTHEHKLKGIATLYVRLEYDAAAFPNGVPQISAVIKGRNDIYDPRTDTTGYSSNAALCMNHYLTTAVRGPGVDYDTEIDEDALIAAANVCDEDVDLLGGGTEKRYTVNGAIQLSDNPEDNLSLFREAMSGDVIYSGGKFQIYAGDYVTPTFEITEDMLVGPITLTNKQPKRERANTIKGVYIDESNGWQRYDFPSVSKASYVTEDGEIIVRDLNFPLVKSPATAQRLAKIVLEEGRLGQTLELKCSLRALKAQAGRNIIVTIPRLGFDETPFKVTDSTFGLSDDGTLNLELAMIRTDPGIYNWSTSDETPVNVPPDIIKSDDKVSDIIATPPPGGLEIDDFPVLVSLSCLTNGVEIRWSKTFLPTEDDDGEEYTDPISVESGETLYARGFRNNYISSNGLIYSYSSEKVEIPNASPEGGAFTIASFPVSVSLTSLTSGSEIRYSKSVQPDLVTDGTEYTAPIDMAADETLYARAFKDGYVSSSPMEETYTESEVHDPEAAPAGGSYDSGEFPKSVTLTCATAGAEIRYSFSAMPTTAEEGTEYTAPISVPGDTTVYFRAFKDDLTDSAGITETYSIAP